MSETRLLAIPNCSEGTRADRIDRLVRSCRVPGVEVIDVHSDPDHDRTVITLAGTADALVDAGVSLAACAAEVIDLREQHGVHPRVGALDVLPFVAMTEAQMPAAIEAARVAGERIAREVGIPVYLYGRAASQPGRDRPAMFRHAGITDMPPDFSPSGGGDGAATGQVPPATAAGVTLVGARGPLIAFNVWLEDATLDDARAVAAAVREGAPGGGLAGVRALGLMCARSGRAQVSMNVEDFRRTPLSQVVARVRSEAAARGRIIGPSELVGTVPAAALVGTTAHDLGLPPLRPELIISED